MGESARDDRSPADAAAGVPAGGRAGDTQNATLHAVSAAVLAVTRHLSVREVLQVIVRGAAALLEARYAALGVPDEAPRRPPPAGPYAGPDGSSDDGSDGGAAASFAEFVVEGVTDEEWSAIGSLPRQHGLLAAMLREGATARLADIRTDPRFEGWPAAHPVLKDFLGVPIRDGDAVVGIIFLANKRRPGGFTARDEELLTLFAAHAAIALANARLYERSRELSVIEERTRLARDLHDAVAQKLFSLRLTAQAAAALAASDTARAVDELGRVQALAAEALAELRAAIFELHPADLADDGLAESLRKHVEVLDRVHAARVVFEVENTAAAGGPDDDGTGGDSPDDDSAGGATAADRDGFALAPDREAAAFRIAQEAIYNALRHAGARRITVRLTRHRVPLTAAAPPPGTGTSGPVRAARPGPAPVAGVILDVWDDGRGFDPAEAEWDGFDGLGLASMRDRARDAGGTLAVCSAPGQGTRVRLTLPAEADAGG